MRWDQIRQGLLAGPMQPGTTDMRKLAHADTDPWGWAPRTDQAIGGHAQSQLQEIEKLNNVMRTTGVPMDVPTATARGTLRTAMQTPFSTAPQPGPDPKLAAVLPELSDIVQGKKMGSQFENIIINDNPQWSDEEEMHMDPSRWKDIPQATPEDREIWRKQDEARNLPPLQRMRPADPSYGDLFRRRR